MVPNPHIHKHEKMSNRIPTLSVITPFSGSETLLHFLKSLTQQSLDHELFELLIVEDGDHGAEELLSSVNSKLQGRVIKLNRPPGFDGHSAGICRNLGARHARANALVFVDSDCILHPDCLRSHLELLRGGFAIGGAARELPTYNQDLLLQDPPLPYEAISSASLIDHRLEPDDDITPPSGNGWDYWYSLNASLMREDFFHVGGFDEKGYRCHDMNLAYRLFKSGISFSYAPSAEVIHIEHPRSIGFRREQMKGWLDLAHSHPELKAFAEDRLIVSKRLLENTLEKAETRFRQLTRDLPGSRIGCVWLLPPGTTEDDLAGRLKHISNISKKYRDLTYLNLKLQRNCWDYAVALPKAVEVEAPLISVLIPAYEVEDKITRAVQSVLLQTLQDFEIIIVDDASSDATLHEVLAFQSDPRVRSFSLRYNEGLSNALNVGLLHSKAPFIIQLDADDWLEPTALESVVTALQEDDSIGAVYGISISHTAGAEIEICEGSQLSTPLDFLECTTPQAPRAFRRSVLFEVGGWSTSDAFFGRYFDDRPILAKVAERYRVKYLPQRLYNIEEVDSSLSRGLPIKFMAGKLAILWEQANRNGRLLSYSFNGRYLRPRFQVREASSVNSNWSVVIPFHRSVDQLKNTVKSWLQSDLMLTNAELIIIDDASGENLDEVVALGTDRIRVIRLENRSGPARARNVGAATARYEMLFFCDADHVVPPDVLSRHERHHASSPEPAIVVGSVFGRRTFFTVSADCRVSHKERLLELLRFDDRFESAASKLACGRQLTLSNGNSAEGVWKQAARFSVTDPWYGNWARIFLSYGETLSDYPHRWTRLNSGNLSIEAELFRQLGGFNEQLQSMEDWEFGIRAQKSNVKIISAPDAEAYHQVHPVDSRRSDKDREAAYFIKTRHEDFIADLLSSRDLYPPPARQLIASSLSDEDSSSSEAEESFPNAGSNYCVLTFDDGPHPLGTSLILDALEKFNFKSTFFFLGTEVEKYPELYRRAVASGHEIGIHGWTHTEVERLTTSENLDVLSRTIDVLNDIAQTDIRFVRPPYGRFNESFIAAAEKLNLTITGWDISSDDWRATSRQDIIKNLAAKGIRGQVILFHDAAGDPTVSVDALEWLLKSCSNFNIDPISLADCAKLRLLPLLKPMKIERWVPDNWW